MNPLTKIRAIEKLKKSEIEAGIEDSAGSWHNDYKDSAYIFVGGLDYELTEGDLLAVFSQYGEIVSTNLVRDKATGKSKGFCFLAYEDQRSTILAVDNFNGIQLCGRTIRVDHVADYKAPKLKEGEERKDEDCAPQIPSPKHQPAKIPTDQGHEDEDRRARKKAKKAKKMKKEEKARSKLGLKTETNRRSIGIKGSSIDRSERGRLLEQRYSMGETSGSYGKGSKPAKKQDNENPSRRDERFQNREQGRTDNGKDRGRPLDREGMSTSERYRERRLDETNRMGRDRHRSRSRSRERVSRNR